MNRSERHDNRCRRSGAMRASGARPSALHLTRSVTRGLPASSSGVRDVVLPFSLRTRHRGSVRPHRTLKTVRVVLDAANTLDGPPGPEGALSMSCQARSLLWGRGRDDLKPVCGDQKRYRAYIGQDDAAGHEPQCPGRPTGKPPAMKPESTVANTPAHHTEESAPSQGWPSLLYAGRGLRPQPAEQEPRWPER